MQRFRLIFLSLFSMTTFCQEQIISQESFPITIKPNALGCSDEKFPHGFFPYEPGQVYLYRQSMTDSAELIEKNAYFTAEFPSNIKCRDIGDALKNVPSELVATRKVFRVVKPTWYEKDTLQSEIHAQVSIELPVANLVLKDFEIDWLEQYNYSPTELPINGHYYIRTHPQAADKDYGLACSPVGPSTQEYQLSMGGFSGDFVFYRPSNTRKIYALFSGEAECKTAQKTLLNELKNEDPDNGGTVFQVERKVNWNYRLLALAHDIPVCRQFQSETLSATFKGYTFTGSNRSFAIKTVSPEFCQ